MFVKMIILRGSRNRSCYIISELQKIYNSHKISCIKKNRARADLEFDSESVISAVPIKYYRRVFLNHKMFPSDVQLKTTSGDIFKLSG